MANKSTFINDLTEGSVMKRLIRFTLPLMLANLLQVCYNLVDMFFVGQYAGTDALSAVSISSNVTMLMFFCFMGIATGGQIYVAQTVGAGRRDKLDRIVGNSLTLCVLVSLILMLTIPLATPILRLINTPEEILGVTRTYLIICTAGNVTVALYNALCGILRGMGDSRHPTMFVAISTAVNIVLDYLFVAVLHWGVAGAAWATVIGQTTACVFALVYLFRKREMLGFDFKLASFGLKSEHVRVILRIGAPIIIKNLFISISVIFVNAMIYRFGVTAAAVIGVCGKLQSLMQVISQAMMDGSASMVGQSVGAGKQERVKRVVWDATLLGAAFAVVWILLFQLFPHQIFSIFSNDPAVIEMAPPFMTVCSINMLAAALMSPTMGLINGVGDTVYNMIVAIADGEERLLLGQVLDKMEHAQRRQEPCATGFLSPKEQRSAEALLNAAGHPRYAAVGGYDGAERRVLVFLPDWMEPEYLQSGDYLSVLRCTWFKEDKLTHRDFLGSLMGMGVRRDTVGDILVGDGSCDILTLPTVAGFLKDSLTSAGRVKLHVSEVPLEEVRVPVQERKVLHDTVAALRLDSVLAVGFSISRSKASQLIASGRCAVNWQDTSKSDLAVRAGDVISCRGLGKCRLAEVGSLSRKGRINVTVERYL